MNPPKAEFLVSSERERKFRLRLYNSSVRREIRHFHVVVVQRRERNVQKSLVIKPIAFLTFSLPSPSSDLKALLSLLGVYTVHLGITYTDLGALRERDTRIFYPCMQVSLDQWSRQSTNHIDYSIYHSPLLQ